MKEGYDIQLCPECGHGVRTIHNKISRHERRLAYVPYELYRRIERITGTSVKEQAKANLCLGSGMLVGKADNVKEK